MLTVCSEKEHRKRNAIAKVGPAKVIFDKDKGGERIQLGSDRANQGQIATVRALTAPVGAWVWHHLCVEGLLDIGAKIGAGCNSSTAAAVNGNVWQWGCAEQTLNTLLRRFIRSSSLPGLTGCQDSSQPAPPQLESWQARSPQS